MMKGPEPDREPRSALELLLFGLGGFSIGFVLGPPAIRFGQVIGFAASATILAAFVFFNFVLSFVGNLLSRDSAREAPENPKDALRCTAAIILGVASGCWAGLQVFQTEAL